MSAREITEALGGKWHGSYGTARCPAHDDKEPSLLIRDDADKRDGLNVHCFTGCDWRDVKTELRRRGLLEDVRPTSGSEKERAERRQPRGRVQPDVDAAARSKAAKAIWRASKDILDTPAETYLRERGLKAGADGWPPTLRCHPALKHHDTGLHFPALVAAVSAYPGRDVRAVHRTYLKLDGTGKALVTRAKMMLGPCGGGAVRLDLAGETLVLAEGIESGLSVRQATGLPVWTCLSTSGLKGVVLPPETQNIIIAADNDEAGIDAANIAAARLTREGRKVKIAKPPPDMDFNDMLLLPENVTVLQPKEAAHG